MDTLKLIQDLEKTAAELETLANQEPEKVASAEEIGSAYLAGLAESIKL
jgi:hypothetical protein